jgi:uncharacterized membrane protein YfcA
LEPCVTDSPVPSSTAPPAAEAAVGHSSGSVARIVAVGLVAGFLSGLFGVGGGILIVPALVLVLHFDQRLAHGTSLAAVLPIAVSSLASYAVEDKVDWPVGAWLAVGAVGGAIIGTHILHRLPHDVLALAFALLLVATAVRLLLDHSEATGRSPLDVVSVITLVLIGLATGILAGLLGVGGGIVMVPAMVVAFGMPAAIAKGTSLLVIVPTALMGTWRNRTKKNADLRVAAILGLAGVASAYVGGVISVGMSESLSNALFATLLIVVAIRMVWQLVNGRRARGDETA